MAHKKAKLYVKEGVEIFGELNLHFNGNLCLKQFHLNQLTIRVRCFSFVLLSKCHQIGACDKILISFQLNATKC